MQPDWCNHSRSAFVLLMYLGYTSNGILVGYHGGFHSDCVYKGYVRTIILYFRRHKGSNVSNGQKYLHSNIYWLGIRHVYRVIANIIIMLSQVHERKHICRSAGSCYQLVIYKSRLCRTD